MIVLNFQNAPKKSSLKKLFLIKDRNDIPNISPKCKFEFLSFSDFIWGFWKTRKMVKLPLILAILKHFKMLQLLASMWVEYPLKKNSIIMVQCFPDFYAFIHSAWTKVLDELSSMCG